MAEFSNHSVYVQLNHPQFSRTFVIAVTSVSAFFWLSFKFWQDVFLISAPVSTFPVQVPHVRARPGDAEVNPSRNAITRPALGLFYGPLYALSSSRPTCRQSGKKFEKEKSESDLKSLKDVRRYAHSRIWDVCTPEGLDRQFVIVSLWSSLNLSCSPCCLSPPQLFSDDDDDDECCQSDPIRCLLLGSRGNSFRRTIIKQDSSLEQSPLCVW